MRERGVQGGGRETGRGVCVGERGGCVVCVRDVVCVCVCVLFFCMWSCAL